MCFGMIAVAVTSNISRNGSNGSVSVSTTVCGSGAVASLMLLNTPRARGARVKWNFMMEKMTSSAVIGVPSWNVTLSCSWNVQVRLSSDSSQLFASSGFGSSVGENSSRLW